MGKREESITRIEDAVLSFEVEVEVEGGTPSDVDALAFEVVVGTLRAMRAATPAAATVLRDMVAVLHGTDMHTRWNADLVRAVDIVEALASDEHVLVTQEGDTRATSPEHRRARVRGALAMPGPDDSVFVSLFSGLTPDAAATTLDSHLDALTSDGRKSPKGIVAALLVDALARGVVFEGSTLTSKSTIASVRKVVDSACVRAAGG